jgi:hypothetical protein
VNGILRFLLRHGEPILFWVLACAHLVPIWGFRYVPTQDGPSHLVNAKILNELAWSNPRFEAYFEVRAEPIPNWTSHVALAGLFYVMPPLIAEKVLVTIYILGFAGAIRYFLGAFGPRTQPLSWLGLALVFNRCLWMGFYNYCLSVPLLWLILGYCLRRRASFGPVQVIVLALLFGLTYFTHLVGFGLAIMGAFAAPLFVGPCRWRRLALTAVAAAPSVFLMMDYFDQTGFFRTGGDQSLLRQPLAFWKGQNTNLRIDQQLRAVDEELLAHHPGDRAPASYWLVPFYLLYLAFAAVEFGYRLWRPVPLAEFADESGPLSPGTSGERGGGEGAESHGDDRATARGDEPSHPSPLPRSTGGEGAGGASPPNGRPAGWLFPAVMGLLFAALFFLLTDHLGAGSGSYSHGGYIKSRLAILPPLVWLGCLREPSWLFARLILRAMTALLLIANIDMATSAVANDNHLLEQVTAGVDAVGSGHYVRSVLGERRDRTADPIRVVANYYCLDADNIYLDNYEAGTAHFPIKFRAGGRRPRSREDLDILICWKRPPDSSVADWDRIVSNGHLQIFQRRLPKKAE